MSEYKRAILDIQGFSSLFLKEKKLIKSNRSEEATKEAIPFFISYAIQEQQNRLFYL